MSETAFWRAEIWHPLSVHFPIALLLFASVTKAASLFLRPFSALFWQKMGSFLLYAGCIFSWLSIYTGDMADGIVARKICDPTVLKAHERSAYYLTYFFSAATVLDLGLRTHLIRAHTRLLHFAVVLLMLTGSVFLVYAGHLGARVVYEQAGGVNIPSGDCAGF